jgi:anthranilate phosphoribosyltransferase
MDIQKAIDVLSRFGHLQAEEAEAVMNQIMRGEATEAQIGAYLMAQRHQSPNQHRWRKSAGHLRNRRR